jgi:hypothetical protein
VTSDDAQPTATTDWNAWHAGYAEEGSALSRRLRIVQARIRDWLDATAERPVTVVSVCAGDGRDLLGVLSERADAGRVSATLLELDASIADRAARAASAAGLAKVRVRCRDAGVTNAFAGAVPADLVLLCGVLGNISETDIRRLLGALPQLCRVHATVIWTRSRRPPDLTPSIRAWFAASGLVEQSFEAPGDAEFSVGVHRLASPPRPLLPDQRLFQFIR